MTMLRSAILLAAAAVVAPVAPVAAQEGPAESSLRWFDSFDRDDDGVLTPAEMEATGMVEFLRIDKDANGTLTVEEYLATNLDTAPDEVRKTRDRFAVMDRRGDGNGLATPVEFVNFGKFIIEIADQNGDGDGRLTRQEFIDSITAPPQ